MDNSCIFCKIVKGDIPSFTIYEDSEFKVILDRFPSKIGHTLIIPKNHIEDIFSITPEQGGRLFQLAVKISKILKDSLGFEAMNVVQNNGEGAGQTVFHFHLHLIPRYKNDCVNISWKPCEPELSDFDEILRKITTNLQNI